MPGEPVSWDQWFWRENTCNACLTPIGLLMNEVVVVAAYSGNLVTSLTSLWRKLSGTSDDRAFAMVPTISGKYGNWRIFWFEAKFSCKPGRGSKLPTPNTIPKGDFAICVMVGNSKIPPMRSKSSSPSPSIFPRCC